VTVDIGRLVQGVTRMVAGLRQPEWRNRALALVASLGLLLLVPADLTRTAATFVPLRQPFRGAELFVDPDTAAARWQAAHGAGWLDPITRHPQARWVNGPTDIPPAAAAARRAHQQGRLAVLVAYHIPDRDCAGPGAGAASSGDYDRFIGQLIAALGPHPVAIVVEPDAVAADCFTSDRARLLSRTVLRLAHAGHHVYLDAGHPNWRPVGEMVGRLLAAGIAGAEGFSVNVANRQTTQDSYEWALKLSDRLGGREFVIDTSRNGVGPPSGHQWCNPRQEALGEPPTTDVDRPGLAALLWIKPPGESDGTCGGKNGHFFSPDLARRLVRNGSGD